MDNLQNMMKTIVCTTINLKPNSKFQIPKSSKTFTTHKGSAWIVETLQNVMNICHTKLEEHTNHS